MYINPFVAGILVTVVIELIFVITGAVVSANKKRK